ncbi:hypothetical protein ACFLTE_10905 [Bacteroidota bacterium]
MKNRIILLFNLVLILGCSKNDQVEKIDLPEVEHELKLEIEEYLNENYMNPEDYVISKYADHDIVIIGEYHRIKHDPELIQHLILKLYENDIYTLGIEFARREDQFLIDSVLNNPTYNKVLAQTIILNFLVFWGYQEYVDIFKIAWQLNQTLPEGNRKFRILGLSDSPDWSLIKTQKDLENASITQQVWKGCSEELWAKVILDEVIAKGEKALIYCGIHHAFTEYKQPIINDEDNTFIGFIERRMGNSIYSEIKKKAITIFLHSPWPSAQGYNEPYVYPADGIIDAVMAEISIDDRRVGFDTKDTPFGKLPGETGIYKRGYNSFTLDMYCDGYIYQMPLSEYNGVTAIEDFINEENIEKARSQSPNPEFRNSSIKDFNNSIKQDADIKRRFASFW